MLQYLFLTGTVVVLGTGVPTQYARAEVKAETQELDNVEYPKINTYGIRKLILQKDGEEVFQISYEPKEYKMAFDYWDILNPYEEAVTVDTEAMYDLYSNVASLNLKEPEELEEDIETGIADSKNSIIIEFVDTANDETARSSAEADSRIELVLGKEDGEGKTYAAIKGYDNQIYSLPSEVVDSIMSLNPFDYILKIPVLVNIDTLDCVKMTISDKEYLMSIEDGEYRFDGKTVKKEDFTTLYQALQSVLLQSEVDEKSQEDSQEILRMVFERNGEEMPDEELVYYSYDDDSYCLSINGTTRFLVGKEDVDELIKQIKKEF